MTHACSNNYSYRILKLCPDRNHSPQLVQWGTLEKFQMLRYFERSFANGCLENGSLHSRQPFVIQRTALIGLNWWPFRTWAGRFNLWGTPWTKIDKKKTYHEAILESTQAYPESGLVNRTSYQSFVITEIMTRSCSNNHLCYISKLCNDRRD